MKFNYFKIFALSILLLPLLHYSQAQEPNITFGAPYIQKFKIADYGIENNNLTITQDTNGIIIIGNSNGILQYDGSHWEITRTKGLPRVTQNQKGDILVAEYNNIGILKYSDSKARLISILDSLTSPPTYLGRINGLISCPHRLYFTTNSHLYTLDEKGLRSIENTPGIQLFKDHNPYASIPGKGLFSIQSDTLKKLIGDTSVSGIQQLQEWNNKLIFSTIKNRLWIGKNGVYYFLHTEAKDYLAEHSISDLLVINPNTLAIGTYSGGIVFINDRGEILNILNKNTNLFDAQINKLFLDINKNLWALHNDGLSRIEISSGLSYFGPENGINGNINSIIKHQGSTYFATSQGIYMLKPDALQKSYSVQFEKIKGLEASCYKFHVFGSQLLTTTSKGTFIIQNDHAFLFNNQFRDPYTVTHQYSKNPSLFIIGGYNGLSLIQYTSGLFINKGKFPRIENQVTSMAEDSRGDLWVTVKNEGIYRIREFSDDLNEVNYKFYSSHLFSNQKINWVRLYATSQGILYSTSDGLFRYNPVDDDFVRDSTLLGKKVNQWVFPIVEDQHNNIWFNVQTKDQNPDNKLVLLKNKENKAKRIILPLNRIKDFNIEAIEPDHNNTLWIGGAEGLVKLDFNQLQTRTTRFKTLLSRVSIHEDSVIAFRYTKNSKGQNPRINYSQNDLRFSYTATHFISGKEILYSTKLEGYEEGWSEWTPQHFKEYTNLNRGNYRFKVKAKDIYGNISEALSYPFYIKPPVYRTWYAYLSYLLFAGLFITVMFKWRSYFYAKEKFKLENIINERTEEVLLQKEKADQLIERLLPKETVKELKTGRKAGPYHYNMVTVLFGDIKGFTKITENIEKVNATSLLDKLDRFFFEFDSIVEKHNIEKIKTIGDAYMCAGGIPEENHTNPIEVIVAALEMQNFMKEAKRQSNDGANIWDLRIGIDTGPIIAGVIGRSKANYDIWGTTVNMASRMESSGEPGKINITGNTFMMIKDFFICRYRGKMPVKNKGEIDMYFVEGFKPNFADDLRGLKANRLFHIHLQLLRFNDLEETILEKMEKGLPQDLHYHNVKHTIDVVTQVELIGKAENVDAEGILLLKTAALFHDIGHIVSYDNHEEEGAKIAQKILPDFYYSEKQISQIVDLIQVTQMPPKPKNHLEKIICDADLDYLGRTDFVPVAYNLYKELREKNKIDSFEQWKKIQIEFIKQHSYFTETAQKLREVNKQKQLEIILNEMQFEERNNNL